MGPLVRRFIWCVSLSINRSDLFHYQFGFMKVDVKEVLLSVLWFRENSTFILKNREIR